jgi:hypothetical protein
VAGSRLKLHGSPLVILVLAFKPFNHIVLVDLRLVIVVVTLLGPRCLVQRDRVESYLLEGVVRVV